MVWFHGRYKTHTYEDCIDFKDKNWYEILNTNPKDIPFNILTNSCKLKKINSPGYIDSLQLEAIKYLLEIKYLLKSKDPNYERKRLDIINRFKLNNSDLNSSFNEKDLGIGIELPSLPTTNSVDGGKKSLKRRKVKKRKTKRRKSKKCFSLF